MRILANIVNWLLVVQTHHKDIDTDRNVHRDPGTDPHKCRYLCTGWVNRHRFPRNVVQQNQYSIGTRIPPAMRKHWNDEKNNPKEHPFSWICAERNDAKYVETLSFPHNMARGTLHWHYNSVTVSFRFFFQMSEVSRALQSMRGW